MTKITHHVDHKEKRATEYPSVGDQLEAIWEMLPASLTAESPVYQKILAVKAKYPKSTRGNK